MNLEAAIALCVVSLAACAPDDPAAPASRCPDGEACSPLTPGGLRFVGARVDGSMIDDPIVALATARGGIQMFGIELPDGEPFGLPYRAEGGDAVVVTRQDGTLVTVSGATEGASFLRIVDPDTGELFGRIALESHPIATVRLYTPWGEIRALDDHAELALWKTTSVLAIALEDAAGDRLVDQAMTIASEGAEPWMWDSIFFASLTQPVQRVVVAAGDHPHVTIDLPIVDAVDAITLDASDPAVVGHAGLLRFSATAGGRFVTGAPWSYASDDGTIDPSVATTSENTAICVPAHAGTMTVTATAGGRQVAFPIAVSN